MHLSQDTMSAVLDVLCSERPTYQAAATAAGISVRSLFCWIRASAKDEADGVPPAESKYGVVWPEETAEPDYLHRAVVLARRMYGVLLDGDTRSLLAGTPRIVIENGKVCWEQDPLLLAQYKNAEEAAIMGIDDWPYKHTPDGARIPLVVVDPLPASARIHLLRSLLPNIYNPESREAVTATHRHEVSGVLEVATPAPQPAAPGATAPAIGNSPSALRADLQRRLAELRANGPEHPRPNAVPPINSATGASGDPVEHVTGSQAPADVAEPARQAERERQHPRAYQAPQPPEPPRPSYARPAPQHGTADGASYGNGRPLPGGYKPQ